MSTKRFSRRQFLVVGGAVTAATALAACGATPTATPVAPMATKPPAPTNTPVPATPVAASATKPPAPAATTAPAAAPTTAPTAAAAATGKWKEAPALADLVKAGKLPPVEQRLPVNPMVLKPIEKTGKYGGTWRTALKGGADDAWMTRTIGCDWLVRWTPAWDGVIPNLAESVNVNPDASEYTFKLRKGLKWSNGDQMGPDDLMFWYNDVLLNKDLMPAIAARYISGGKPMTVTKLDDLTVKMSFVAPSGLFMMVLATPDCAEITNTPMNYAKQFHKNYQDPAKLAALVAENKVDDWVKLFQSKVNGIPGTAVSGRWTNKDLPSMYPWYVTTAYGSGKERVVAARNAYYWKVDTEGNQLPYIDNIWYDYAEDIQVLALKALNGEIDFMDRHFNTAANKPLFVDGQKKGDFWLNEEIATATNDLSIQVNMTHKDPQLRAILSDINFRIGLSYAINRQELIDLVWVGQGEPWQMGPQKTTRFYSEKHAKQYTEYDVKKANEYLDKVLPKKDANGMRLMPDGKPFSVIFDIANSVPVYVSSAPVLQKYWKAVGLDIQNKIEDRSLSYARKDGNDCDFYVWGGGAGLGDTMLDGRSYFPASQESAWGVAWYYWWIKDPRGMEPPDYVKKQFTLYDQLKATGDPAKQDDLWKQILAVAEQQFYCVGITSMAPGWGMCKNNVKNVPKSFPQAWLYPTPGPLNPPTFFFDT